MVVCVPYASHQPKRSEELTGVSIIQLSACILAKSKILFINSQKLEPLQNNIFKTKSKTVHYKILEIGIGVEHKNEISI